MPLFRRKKNPVVIPVTNDDLREVFVHKYFNANDVIEKYKAQHTPEEYVAHEKKFVQESLDNLLSQTRSNSIYSDFNDKFQFLQPYATQHGINISELANEMLDNMFLWHKAVVEVAYDNSALSYIMPELLGIAGQDPTKYDEQYANIALNGLTKAVENKIRFKPENLQWWIFNASKWSNNPEVNAKLYSIVKDHEIPAHYDSNDEMSTGILTGIVDSLEYVGEEKHISSGFGVEPKTKILPNTKVTLKSGNTGKNVTYVMIDFRNFQSDLIGELMRCEDVNSSFYEGTLGTLSGAEHTVRILSGKLKNNVYSNSYTN